MLPSVDFCGIKVTRLILGANPFGGYSHQNEKRDNEMLSYYTSNNRIIETWDRAEKAGINTIITNNETPHIVKAVEKYFSEGGRLQWIAQLNCRQKPDIQAAIDEAVRIGCKAVYLHGARLDDAYAQKDEKAIRTWCEYARKAGIPAGVAGHSPKAHLWADKLNIVDFHVVCFFNCGSLHSGKGERFRLNDIIEATNCIKRIRKPCIAYKIMGAGRIDARMAFEYAYENIKPNDVVNVGMYRGDNDSMVEDNVSMVKEILKKQ